MIWIIGVNGMFGSEMARRLEANNIPYIGSGSEVDITSIRDLDAFVLSNDREAGRTGNAVTRKTVPTKIKWIINCAGYTDVENAEDEGEFEKAYQLNVEGPKNISRIARKIGAKLIHISTDYVFDGKSKKPYDEEAPKAPLNVYATTKSLGEDVIAKEMTQYYIMRTSWLYGYGGSNFVYKMTNLMNSRETIKVVNDQIGSPTSAEDLANVIIRIIDVAENAKSLFGKNAALPYGIYNFSDSGTITWYDFAGKIYDFGKKYKRITSDCDVTPCYTNEYQTKVERPQYSVLDKTKIQNALKIRIPKWQDSLERFIKNPLFRPANP